MKKKYILLVACAFLWAFSGCVSKKDYEEKVGQLEEAKQQVAKLQAQLKEKEAKIAGLEKSKDQISNELLATRQKLETFEKETRDMANAKTKELEKVQSAFDNLRSQSASIQRQLIEKSESLSQLQGLLSQKEKSLGEFRQMLEQKTSALSALQNQFDKLSGSSLGNISELTKLKAQVSQKDSALKEKDQQIVARDASLKEKDSQIDALMKQIEMLKKGAGSGLGGLKGLMKK